jgi:hypothetical protein
VTGSASLTEYRDADLIRAVPGSRWDRANRVWTVPLSWASCLTMRGLFRDRLEIGPELERWAWAHRCGVIAPALRLRTELEGDLATEGADRLYGFQRAGVKFLATVRKALLLDEMGTGKTIQGIYTLRTLDEQSEDVFPALVVCPNSMKSTWVREFGNWWPSARVAMLDGTKAKRLKVIEAVKAGEVDVLVVNWEGLRGHSKLAGYGSTELKGCSNCGPSSRRPEELPALPARAERDRLGRDHRRRGAPGEGPEEPADPGAVGAGDRRHHDPDRRHRHADRRRAGRPVARPALPGPEGVAEQDEVRRPVVPGELQPVRRDDRGRAEAGDQGRVLRDHRPDDHPAAEEPGAEPAPAQVRTRPATSTCSPSRPGRTRRCGTR